MTTSTWDHNQVRARLAECGQHGSSIPMPSRSMTPASRKTGSITGCGADVLRGAGQARQLPDRVSVHAVTGRASTALNWRLYLPKSWDDQTATDRWTDCCPAGAVRDPRPGPVPGEVAAGAGHISMRSSPGECPPGRCSLMRLGRQHRLPRWPDRTRTGLRAGRLGLDQRPSHHRPTPVSGGPKLAPTTPTNPSLPKC
ncbi:hypothetical protein ACFZC5_36305 [Nocardia gamkensis]|uniref:hypothetical protein n=1 Tax=Nocardia gamkensis TaxID=352869 RepID=UPI0036E31BDD